MLNAWECNFANTDNVFQADKLKTISCTPGDAVACGWLLKDIGEKLLVILKP